MLCRDCLVHLSFVDIVRALNNIKRSGISYLLTTTFPDCDRNEDTVTGDWRVLNLERPPFSFTEGGREFRDKSLGLWLVRDLPTAHDEVLR